MGWYEEISDDRMAYRVRGHNHLLDIILPFFERHKLKSKKRVEFQRFRSIVLMVARKDHLTDDGLTKIKTIAATISKHPVSINDPVEATH